MIRNARVSKSPSSPVQNRHECSTGSEPGGVRRPGPTTVPRCRRTPAPPRRRTPARAGAGAAESNREVRTRPSSGTCAQRCDWASSCASSTPGSTAAPRSARGRRRSSAAVPTSSTSHGGSRSPTASRGGVAPRQVGVGEVDVHQLGGLRVPAARGRRGRPARSAAPTRAMSAAQTRWNGTSPWPSSGPRVSRSTSGSCPTSRPPCVTGSVTRSYIDERCQLVNVSGVVTAAPPPRRSGTAIAPGRSLGPSWNAWNGVSPALSTDPAASSTVWVSRSTVTVAGPGVTAGPASRWRSAADTAGFR